MKKKSQLLLSFLILVSACKVYGQAISVSPAAAVKLTDFSLVGNKTAAPIVIDDADHQSVKIAAGLFAQDVKRVTGILPQVGPLGTAKPDMVIAGTIGKSTLIDKLIAQGKIASVDKIKGKWEASLWQVVANPVAGVKKALVIVGSDRRGTAYGLMQLSKKIGVSPWYWWADVPVKQQTALTLNVAQPTWDAPAVKYRGIFINDEDWGINQWARKTFEKEFGAGVGPKTYEKVFELMLRLRLNYIWPAMHEVSKEFGDTPENAELADRYGIVAGSSHCEPMLYNNVHWDSKLKGGWNYSTNKDSVYKYWKQTTLDRKDKEAVWTVGIRGIHDRGMETPPGGIPDRINLMEHILKDQRDLINNYVTKQYGPVAQCFVPYKEVLTLYDAGLKVPEDVTLMWVDDNFGYIRRFSNPDERKRAGGSGVYWHLSYYGQPHSYTWINTTAPALIWEELHKAWENQARSMWVINVGDIKPMETGIDYFSRLAWDPEAQHNDTQPQFLKSFLEDNFNAELGKPLNQLLTDFYRLGTTRKPELMNREWALTLSDQNARQLQSEYENILQQDRTISARVPAASTDAYTELVGFPARVLAATGLIFMNDRSKVLGADSITANVEIEKLKHYLEGEVSNYNTKIAGGKWAYMMPGLTTGKFLMAWNSQVAWPWGEKKQPDAINKTIDSYIIRKASSADGRTVSGPAQWTAIPGLGNSGEAMALQPASLSSSWKPGDQSAPTLTYNFKANGKPTQALIDFMPTFRLYPGMQLRVAIAIDGKLLSTVEVPGSNGKEDEKGPNRNQGIRNNYVRSVIDLSAMSAGDHKLSIMAVDPGVVIDRVSFSN
ncbi:glycosyl hydrolase 115 family protein [Mucilaginibacter sp. HMF5004]|uniref:glycosyl hydrolase 115 family protein n=1 Tax=Mucilaginibacter rivuli TaxID=2857527 RepID=UPI001C5F05A7|nr:glycosyl hydrolase 115 family protein [Mucilaginibacter rivuli]MBW4888491.1 glycosyl hydrolase 115 family protein [Mucilaginibacter rivuli]